MCVVVWWMIDELEGLQGDVDLQARTAVRVMRTILMIVGWFITFLGS